MLESSLNYLYDIFFSSSSLCILKNVIACIIITAIYNNFSKQIFKVQVKVFANKLQIYCMYYDDDAKCPRLFVKKDGILGFYITTRSTHIYP